MDVIDPFIGLISMFILSTLAILGAYFKGNKSGKSKVLMEMEKENANSANEAKERLVDITGADDVEYIKQLRDSQR